MKKINLDAIRKAYKGKSTLAVARGMAVLRLLLNDECTFERIRRHEHLSSPQLERAIRAARDVLEGSGWRLACDRPAFCVQPEYYLTRM